MNFHSSIVQTRIASPLGPIVLAATSTGLAGLWFDDQRHLPTALLPGAGADPLAPAPRWPHDDAHPLLQRATCLLNAYFAGESVAFDVPLDLAGGTLFQQAVWRALLQVPHGRTSSYGALAASIGRSAAVRAVGAAVGRNPLSIVVPCHRVLGATGALTGYAGGLPRKIALLELEKSLPVLRAA